MYNWACVLFLVLSSGNNSNCRQRQDVTKYQEQLSKISQFVYFTPVFYLHCIFVYNKWADKVKINKFEICFCLPSLSVNT